MLICQKSYTKKTNFVNISIWYIDGTHVYRNIEKYLYNLIYISVPVKFLSVNSSRGNFIYILESLTELKCFLYIQNKKRSVILTEICGKRYFLNIKSVG